MERKLRCRVVMFNDFLKILVWKLRLVNLKLGNVYIRYFI